MDFCFTPLSVNNPIMRETGESLLIHVTAEGKKFPPQA